MVGANDDSAAALEPVDAEHSPKGLGAIEGHGPLRRDQALQSSSSPGLGSTPRTVDSKSCVRPTPPSTRCRPRRARRRCERRGSAPTGVADDGVEALPVDRCGRPDHGSTTIRFVGRSISNQNASCTARRRRSTLAVIAFSGARICSSHPSSTCRASDARARRLIKPVWSVSRHPGALETLHRLGVECFQAPRLARDTPQDDLVGEAHEKMWCDGARAHRVGNGQPAADAPPQPQRLPAALGRRGRAVRSRRGHPAPVHARRCIARRRHPHLHHPLPRRSLPRPARNVMQRGTRSGPAPVRRSTTRPAAAVTSIDCGTPRSARDRSGRAAPPGGRRRRRRTPATVHAALRAARTTVSRRSDGGCRSLTADACCPTASALSVWPGPRSAAAARRRLEVDGPPVTLDEVSEPRPWSVVRLRDGHPLCDGASSSPTASICWCASRRSSRRRRPGDAYGTSPRPQAGGSRPMPAPADSCSRTSRSATPTSSAFAAEARERVRRCRRRQRLRPHRRPVTHRTLIGVESAARYRRTLGP